MQDHTHRKFWGMPLEVWVIIIVMLAGFTALVTISSVSPQWLSGETDELTQTSEVTETPIPEDNAVQSFEDSPRTVSEILATLNQEELEDMLLSFRWRFGGTEPIGNYQLRSPDDGETWFVIRGFDGVGEFIGPAEEVYPGLVACLDARNFVVQYARNFRPIPPEEENQTEAEQALLIARSIACDNFQALNRPE